MKKYYTIHRSLFWACPPPPFLRRGSRVAGLRCYRTAPYRSRPYTRSRTHYTRAVVPADLSPRRLLFRHVVLLFWLCCSGVMGLWGCRGDAPPTPPLPFRDTLTHKPPPRPAPVIQPAAPAVLFQYDHLVAVLQKYTLEETMLSDYKSALALLEQDTLHFTDVYSEEESTYKIWVSVPSDQTNYSLELNYEYSQDGTFSAVRHIISRIPAQEREAVCTLLQNKIALYAKGASMQRFNKKHSEGLFWQLDNSWQLVLVLRNNSGWIELRYTGLRYVDEQDIVQ